MGTSTADKQQSQPAIATGTFTSAGTAEAEVITIGWDPSCMILFFDMEGTNVDYIVSFNGATSCSHVTGADGISTTPANEVTYTGDGTVSVGTAAQTDSGVNYWIAIR